VEVIPLAVARRAHRARFLAVPAPLYRGDPRYVPPLRRELHRLLDPTRNPWYRHSEMALFVAIRGRQTVGRIAAIVDRRHQEVHRERVGFFGFFDCIDDTRCASALLGTAEDWVRARGADAIRGPISPSMHDESGCLVSGFDSPPVLQMTYNPPYYAHLFEACGYRKERDLLAYEALSSRAEHPVIDRIAQAIDARNDIRIRSLDRRRFWHEVEVVRGLYNAAWEMNWGFVPLDGEEFEWRARSLKDLIDPRFALLVEARRDDVFEPVAFGLALPNLNEILIDLKGRLTPLALFRIVRGLRRVRTIRLLLLGVTSGYRKRGLEALLIREVHRRCVAAGIDRVELSWVLEDNLPMNRTILKSGCRHYKTYRIFGKSLP